MKKIINALLVCALAAGLCGCQKKSSDHYAEDGVFTGTADGYGGKISVDVEFENNKIASVEVKEQSESATIADDALEKVPAHIVAAQSINVDVSTGATVTSKAVMSAVGQAIAAAGGNVNEWSTDATGQNKTVEKTVETQAVIIGGGVSGIAAVLRLEQLGVNTVLVEKSEALGGSFQLTDNQSQLAVSTSDLSNQENPVESPADLYKDVYAYGANQGNEDLLHLLFTNLTKTTEWETDDLGLAFQPRKKMNGYSGNAVAEYDNSNSSTGELLAKEADICGADILIHTAMTGFIKDDEDNVTGVIAKASNGTYYRIKADYVILAAGSSSGGNDDLPYYGVFENTNDLVTIADNDDVLSSVSGENVTAHTGINLGNGKAVDAIDAMHAALNEGLIVVNQNGERFVNEDASMYEISLAVDDQPSQASYLIMSVGAYRTFRRDLSRNAVLTDDMKDELEDEESDFNTSIYCKDIRDISKKFGIDQSTLLNTILNFNEDTQKKSDSVFGRLSFDHAIDVGDELIVIPLCTYKTGDLGGIQVDNTLHVLNDTGESVANVLCIGSAAGGVFGSAAAGGTLNTWAFVSGKTAADEVAAALSHK